MNEILALPTGPLVDASLALVRATESRPIVDHSIRTFLFARLLAEHEGCLNDVEYDEQCSSPPRSCTISGSASRPAVRLASK